MIEKKPIIAERIKKLRKEKGFTQEQLAEILGLNAKSSIANYESGANSPSDEIKKKICELFNCSMDYLMGLTSYINPIEDLEKELYQCNLNIEEYNELLSLFLDEKKDDVEKVLHKNDKINIAFQKCLEIVFDYDDSGIISIDENIDKIKNIISSLDKSKIIHNYNETTAKQCTGQNNYKKSVNPDNGISYEKQFYMCPVYGTISVEQPNWAEECIEGRIPINYELMNIANPEDHFFLRVNGESMNRVVKNGAYALIHKQDTVENGEIAVVLVNRYNATLKKFTQSGNVVVLEPMSDDNTFQTQIYNEDTDIKVLGKYIGKFEINK